MFASRSALVSYLGGIACRRPAAPCSPSKIRAPTRSGKSAEKRRHEAAKLRKVLRQELLPGVPVLCMAQPYVEDAVERDGGLRGCAQAR
jgi:hypothetical protein